MTIEEQRQEAMNDVREFFVYVEAYPDKSFTLKLEGGKGKYRGAGLEINKPAGKGLNFTEQPKPQEEITCTTETDAKQRTATRS